MKKRVGISTLGMWLWLATATIAQPTFHTLLVASTQDASIGMACQVDIYAAQSRFATIAQQLGYRYAAHVVKDQYFGLNGLIAAIRDVTCQPNDIIVFYYTGHGFNASQHKSDFPLLQFNPTTDRTIPSLELVHTLLLDKKPRFCLTIGDCCNKLIDEGLPTERSLVKGTTYNADIVKQLFLQQRGGVLVASSKRGQPSGASPNGSHFTWALLQSLDYACYYNQQASWPQVLEDTQNRMQHITMARMSGQQSIYRVTESGQNSTDGGAILVAADTLPAPIPAADPVIELPSVDSVAISASIAPTPPAPTTVAAPNITPTPNRPAYNRVNQFLNELVDESKPYAIRKQVQQRAGQYFAYNARVRVFVGTTQVEQMPLAELMTRYNLLATKIRQVNVVETLSKLDLSGQLYTEIAIQEIWNQ